MSVLEKVDRPNTLVATIPAEFSGLSRCEIVEKLVAGLDASKICCIQFVPRCYARITFSSFDARNRALLSGLFIDSTRLLVVEAEPLMKDVFLDHCPVEVPDDAIRQAFSRFGAVHSITELMHAGTSIGNGTRLLKMSLASDVPVNLRILRYPCRVYYTGQPRPCPICRSPDHRAADCSLRDVCRRCHEPGHFARDCTADLTISTAVLDDDDDDDDADFDDNDDDDSVDDDDDDATDDELASGDEEVLASAPAPSGSAEVSSSPPAPAPVPASPPVTHPSPMDCSIESFSDDPRWIARAPYSIRALLSDGPHSSDTHIGHEHYPSGIVLIAFDFGKLTFRIIKESRNLDEDRFFAYLTGAVSRPAKSSFVNAATNMPRLPADVVLASFPVSR